MISDPHQDPEESSGGEIGKNFIAPNQAQMLEHDLEDINPRLIDLALKMLLEGAAKEKISEALLQKQKLKVSEISKIVSTASVEWAARTLAMGWTPAQTRRSLALRLDCTPRACHPIIQQAQTKLAEAMDMSPREMKSWIGTLFMKMFRDKDVKDTVKIKALDSFARLYGLNSPVDVNVKGSVGLTIHDVVRRVETKKRTLVVGDAYIEDVVHSALEEQQKQKALESPSGNGSDIIDAEINEGGESD